MTDISYSKGEPWRVTISRVGDGHVIHLYIGNAMVTLSALEAHKLGSALHAASGLDETPIPGDFYVCPAHNATGGYESCCECGGWHDDDPDRGRMCSEASDG